MTEVHPLSSLEKRLRVLSREISEDRYMLVEYLIPVIDGCRAALRVEVGRARDAHKMSEDDFNECLNSGGQSLKDLAVCFTTTDTHETVSVVIEKGRVSVLDECFEPSVVVTSESKTYADLLDPDSRLSPVSVLGKSLKVDGLDAEDVIQTLGLLCFPSLWRMARSGIVPDSALAEDGDSVIMAAASGLVTKMVKTWVEQQVMSGNGQTH